MLGRYLVTVCLGSGRPRASGLSADTPNKRSTIIRKQAYDGRTIYPFPACTCVPVRG